MIPTGCEGGNACVRRSVASSPALGAEARSTAPSAYSTATPIPRLDRWTIGRLMVSEVRRQVYRAALTRARVHGLGRARVSSSLRTCRSYRHLRWWRAILAGLAGSASTSGSRICHGAPQSSGTLGRSRG